MIYAMDFDPKAYFEEKKKLPNLLNIAEILVFLKIQRSIMWPHDLIVRKLDDQKKTPPKIADIVLGGEGSKDVPLILRYLKL